LPWLLGGSVVGSGPDHEPLIDHVRTFAIVGPTGVEEAVRANRDGFAAGQTSENETPGSQSGHTSVGLRTQMKSPRPELAAAHGDGGFHPEPFQVS